MPSMQSLRLTLARRSADPRLQLPICRSVSSSAAVGTRGHEGPDAWCDLVLTPESTSAREAPASEDLSFLASPSRRGLEVMGNGTQASQYLVRMKPTGTVDFCTQAERSDRRSNTRTSTSGNSTASTQLPSQRSETNESAPAQRRSETPQRQRSRSKGPFHLPSQPVTERSNATDSVLSPSQSQAKRKRSKDPANLSSSSQSQRSRSCESTQAQRDKSKEASDLSVTSLDSLPSTAVEDGDLGDVSESRFGTLRSMFKGCKMSKVKRLLTGYSREEVEHIWVALGKDDQGDDRGSSRRRRSAPTRSRTT